MKRPTTTATVALALAGLLPALGCGTVNQAVHPLPPPVLGRLGAEIHDRFSTVQADTAEDTRPRANRVDTFDGRTYLEGAMLRVVTSAGDRRIPLGQVREIDADHSGMGLVLGAAAGGLAGAGLGWLMAFESSKEHQGFEGLYVFMMAAVGILAGAPTGAYLGSGPEWRFSAPGQ